MTRARAVAAKAARLGLVVGLLAGAACGAAPGSEGAFASMATANPVAATPATGARPGSGSATLGAASLRGAMTAVSPSVMGSDLAAIGLDPKALPPLAKLEPDKLRRVMRTFTKSLGAVCADCHVENDFAAPTPRKAIAAKMWDRFARSLTTADGALLYCDSCHHGHIAPLLDRRDEKALSTWMDENYVTALRRSDGREHTCDTCHGDPFEGRFLGKWAQLPAGASLHP